MFNMNNIINSIQAIIKKRKIKDLQQYDQVKDTRPTKKFKVDLKEIEKQYIQKRRDNLLYI